jgi:hypothetical protein
MPRPPDGAMVVKYQGQRYYSGTVCIRAEADTARLKQLGFRALISAGHSAGSLRYQALWPNSTVIIPMPDFMTGLEYTASGLPGDFSMVAPEDDKGGDSIEGELLLQDVLSPQYDSMASTPQEPIIVEPPPKPAVSEIQRLSIESNGDGRAETWFLHYPVPADGKTDTSFDGKGYIRGLVLCASHRDLKTLERLGFTDISDFAQPLRIESYFNLETGDSVYYRVLNAYWPPKIETDDLPLSVPQIIALRCKGAKPVFSKVHMRMPVDNKP